LLMSSEIANRIVDSSNLAAEDTVIEIGAGQGVLTGRIAQQCKTVRSYELDRRLYEKARTFLSQYQNIDLILGDAFQGEIDSPFDVCITNLPYSESLRFIKWLCARPQKFRLAVAMLQTEFTEKLLSPSGKDSYRAISVIAQLSFDMEMLFSIGPEVFVPKPRVTSSVMRFKPKEDAVWPVIDGHKIALMNSLFSFRGRRVSSALQKIIGRDGVSTISKELTFKRIETLSPEEFSLILGGIDAQKNESRHLSL
jgi:16S rRNA (adenine1518-N6/adenine1519-N6)-dimethyltransferase